MDPVFRHQFVYTSRLRNYTGNKEELLGVHLKVVGSNLLQFCHVRHDVVDRHINNIFLDVGKLVRTFRASPFLSLTLFAGPSLRLAAQLIWSPSGCLSPHHTFITPHTRKSSVRTCSERAPRNNSSPDKTRRFCTCQPQSVPARRCACVTAARGCSARNPNP